MTRRPPFFPFSRPATGGVPRLTAAENNSRGIRRFSPATAPADYTDPLVFLAGYLAPLPPSGEPDYLLLSSVQDEDVPLAVILPANLDDPDADTLQLRLNGQLVGTPQSLSGYQAGDTYVIWLSADVRKAAGDGTHTLSYELQFFWGGGAEKGPDQTFRIDTVPPGLPELGKLRIDEDIIKNGLTSDKLKEDDEGNFYLETFVPSYNGAEPGDLIAVVLNGTPHFGAVVEERDIGLEVMLPFSRELLEEAELAGGGLIYVGYTIIDRAGNTPLVSTPQPLEALLAGEIRDLEAPLVPLADDGLLNYKDGLTPAFASIPGHDRIKAGDGIILKVGDTELGRVTVPADGQAGTPLLDISIPFATLYAEWAALTAGANQKVDLPVSYRILRGTMTAGTSPATDAPTNLHVPGGEPGPDPVHDQLKAPVVRSDSGATDRIPVEDSDKDATVIISWTNSGTPPMDIFLEGDEVVVSWGSEVLATYVVSDTDVGARADLNITLPADAIKRVGSGNITTFYEVTRALVPPEDGSNTARSPDKVVNVASGADLPGGGSGLVAGVYAPLNARGAIGPEEIRAGVTFTIPPYVNQKAGDTVKLTFARYPGSSHKDGETALPGSEWEYDGVISADTGDFVITIPQQYLITPLQLSHADTTYTIANSFGAVTSATKLIVIDPRGF